MKKTKLKTLRLREDVVTKVENMAKEDNRSFTNMVETLILRANYQQTAL